MQHLSDKKINILRQDARSVVRELGLLNDAYFEVGITLAERHLLIELASAHVPLTARDIAERLLLDKSTVSRLVARASKKGFITCLPDQKDKRKRFLQFTDLGRTTLNTFEPIAFDQTKKALQTLSVDEIDLVYQGVALYSQGLKNSRLQNFASTSSQNGKKIESLDVIHDQLLQLGYKLAPYKAEDEEGLFAIFREVVENGYQFSYESTSIEEFRTQFLAPTAQVYTCHSLQDQVIGGFYLKPNYSGKAKHIANAGYMITSTRRGCGIGTLLVQASLHLAHHFGFLAMQFNMVLSQNIPARKLYEKLGFRVIGTVPDAIRNPDGSFQDTYIMHRKIDKL